MKTGLLEGDASEADLEMLDTIAALMRVFTRDAIRVAVSCARADRRSHIDVDCMRGAMKYSARTFIQNNSDDELARLVREERAVMETEESDEEEESGESDDANEEEEGEATEEATEDDVRLRKHVDKIVETWNLWHPTDQMHALIKQAIDNT